MSFILAQTVMFQLSTLDSSLLARINHISLIHSEVKAIVDAKEDLKISKEDIAKMQAVEDNIEALRNNYEPFLDDAESKQVGDEKRKLSEKLLDLSRYNLLYIIEKYRLVDIKTLQDVTGVPWGET
jgi:hypothetical protein